MDLLKYEAGSSQKDIPELIRALENESVRNSIFKLTKRAPLALHFFIGLVKEYDDVEEVLTRFRSPKNDPRIIRFYEFTIHEALLNLSNQSKAILQYMGQMAITSVRKSELKEGLLTLGYKKIDVEKSLGALRLWHLVEEDKNPPNQTCFDLHPWVRNAVLQGLVGKLKLPPHAHEKILRKKLGLNSLKQQVYAHKT